MYGYYNTFQDDSVYDGNYKIHEGNDDGGYKLEYDLIRDGVVELT